MRKLCDDSKSLNPLSSLRMSRKAFASRDYTLRKRRTIHKFVVFKNEIFSITYQHGHQGTQEHGAVVVGPTVVGASVVGASVVGSTVVGVVSLSSGPAEICQFIIHNSELFIKVKTYNKEKLRQEFRDFCKMVPTPMANHIVD